MLGPALGGALALFADVPVTPANVEEIMLLNERSNAARSAEALLASKFGRQKLGREEFGQK